MNAFTLRLEPTLDRQLDKICRERGYSKTGLIKALIRDFVSQNEKTITTMPAREQRKSLTGLVGIVKLGGDSVQDAEDVWT